MGVDRGFFLDCVLSCCSSNLTDICKRSISREYSHGEEAVLWTGDTGWLQPHCGGLQLPRGAGGCLYVHGCIRRSCLGNVNGRYGTKTRQSPEIVIKVHHCSSP